MPSTRDASNPAPSSTLPPAGARSWYASGLFWTTAAVAVVASIVAFQLWGTIFTCDDDLFTATAWQRLGGPSGLVNKMSQLPLDFQLPQAGWPAILGASWKMAKQQGRFYQLAVYTLAQIPYRFGSVAAVNVVRILCVLLVFAAFTAMLAELLRSLRLALCFSVLSIALLQTKYQYNPFHALPLWFSFGIALLFLSVFLFSRGLTQPSSALRYAGAIAYACSLLFYEPFVFYGMVFFLVAFIRLDSGPRKLAPRTFRALAAIWPFAAAVAIYLVAYVSFSAAHPTSYSGRSASLAAPWAILKTILIFSTSGLNFGALLHLHRTWSFTSALVSVIVCLIVFASLRRFHARLPVRTLLAILGFAALGMLLPNVMYGFTARYRHWAIASPFYLGSFYSAFPCAVFVGTASLILVRMLARVRMANAGAAAIAVFFAVTAYGNANETRDFFDQHRENRMLWNIVDDCLARDHGRLFDGASIVVAPALERMPLLNPANYDYWSFYFTRKLGRPCRVVGSPTEFALLPEELRRGRVLAFVPRYDRALGAALFAVGPLDVATWNAAPWQLFCDRANIGVIGKDEGLSVTATSSGAGNITLRAGRHLMIEGKGAVDLNSVALQ